MDIVKDYIAALFFSDNSERKGQQNNHQLSMPPFKPSGWALSIFLERITVVTVSGYKRYCTSHIKRWENERANVLVSNYKKNLTDKGERHVDIWYNWTWGPYYYNLNRLNLCNESSAAHNWNPSLRLRATQKIWKLMSILMQRYMRSICNIILQNSKG